MVIQPIAATTYNKNSRVSCDHKSRITCNDNYIEDNI